MVAPRPGAITQAAAWASVYQPIYRPSPPGGLRSATKANDVGKLSISPMVTITIARTQYSPDVPKGSMPNPRQHKKLPQPIVRTKGQLRMESTNTISNSTMINVLTANISPMRSMLNPK